MWESIEGFWWSWIMNTFSNFDLLHKYWLFLIFKTSSPPPSISHWAQSNDGSTQTEMWSRFVSGTFSKAEMPMCLDQVSSLPANWAVSGVFLCDISVPVGCWNGFRVSYPKPFPGIVQELGCFKGIFLSWRPGQSKLLVHWSLSGLAYLSGWVERLFYTWAYRRSLGDCGVSQIAVLQMKLLGTKLPFLLGLPNSLLPVFLQSVSPLLLNHHCSSTNWGGFAENADSQSSLCPPFISVCLLLWPNLCWVSSELAGIGCCSCQDIWEGPTLSMYWIKLSTAFACSLLLNGNNEERFTSLEKIPYWVRTAGVQMYYCTSEMFVISKLAEVRISGNWHLWSYASFYKLVLEQWQAWTIMVQLAYFAV